MYYNIAKRILCMSLKFCIVMYKYYGPVAFNCKIKYLYCIVLYFESEPDHRLEASILEISGRQMKNWKKFPILREFSGFL